MSAPWNEPEAPYWSEVYADAYVDLLMAQEVPGSRQGMTRSGT